MTDQAIDLFERLIGTMFSKAETRHARAFQAAGRAINEKVRLYARVGAALIAAREGKQDPFDAITAVISWDRFRATVAKASALARSEEFDRALCRRAALDTGLFGNLYFPGRAGLSLAAPGHRHAARHE